MALFTVIVGDAYDSGSTIYLVEAINAAFACEQARNTSKAHDENRGTVLFCMEGAVAFCPTVFTGEFEREPYTPPVIDTRPPDPEAVVARLVPADQSKVVEALKGLSGPMLVPVDTQDTLVLVNAPGWTREKLEGIIKEAAKRVDFTMSWTTLSAVQRRANQLA